MAFLELKNRNQQDGIRKPWLEFLGTSPLPKNPGEPSAKQINWTTELVRGG